MVNATIETRSRTVSGHFPAAVLRCSAFLPSRRLWVGYQYVITGQNHSLEGHWEVAAFKGKPS